MRESARSPSAVATLLSVPECFRIAPGGAGECPALSVARAGRCCEGQWKVLIRIHS